MAACAVDGCERQGEKRGWCSTHYKRWLAKGDPGSAVIRVKRYAAPCSVAGCEKRAKSIGMCATHRARVKRRGDAGGAALQHAVSYDGQACSVDDCQKVAKSRGYCIAHWKRWKRWGDPTVKRPQVPAAVRFAKAVKQGAPPEARPGLGPCHIWTAGKSRQGYGVLSTGESPKKQELAHRWIYKQTFGEIPEDMVIDHLCRVRACVNPSHMEPVANLENLRRGAGYGLRNGMRNECIHGHEYTAENTYTAPDGGIRCRKCARIQDRNRVRPSRKAA